MSLHCDYNQLEAEVSLCEWHRWERHYVHEISLRLEPNFKLDRKKIIPHPGTWNILIIQMGTNNGNICHKSCILFWHTGVLFCSNLEGLNWGGCEICVGEEYKGRFCNIIRNATLKISGNGFSSLCFISVLEFYFPFCIICGVTKYEKMQTRKNVSLPYWCMMEKGLKESNNGSLKFCLVTWREQHQPYNFTVPMNLCSSFT
jgi:hypothetical protein